MRKCIAIAALLFMCAVPGRAQFTNNYAQTLSYRYDPNTGSNGTIYITSSITGTMTSPGIPCNYMHTPSVAVKLPNGVTTNRVSGSAVSACSNMGFSTVFTFDLASTGCSPDLLAAGQCQYETQPQIYCPHMGYFWTGGGSPRITQFEIAWTYTKPTDPECYPYSCVAQQNCTSETTPPDYWGPYPDQGDNYPYLRHALLYRTSNVVWHNLWNFSPPQNLYLDNSPHTCTRLDAGYPSNPGGPPTPH